MADPEPSQSLVKRILEVVHNGRQHAARAIALLRSLYADFLILAGISQTPDGNGQDIAGDGARKHRVALGLLPVVVLVTSMCVCISAWIATFGLLPNRVDASGISVLVADYRPWDQKYIPVAFNVAGLATAAAAGEAPWESLPTTTPTPTQIPVPVVPLASGDSVDASAGDLPTPIPPSSSTGASSSGASADLAVIMISAQSSAIEKDTLYYSARITNNGPNTATAVTLSSAVSSWVTLVSATASQGSCSTGLNTADCSLGNIAAGRAASFTIAVRPPMPGTLNGRVSAFSSVTDPNGGDNSAVWTTIVDPIPNAPVAIDDIASTLQDVAIDIAVLANDSDPDGNINPFSVAVIDGPFNGNLLGIDGPSGTITYAPRVGFSGTDRFDYQVCDFTGLCDTASVLLTVIAAASPPVANNDSASTSPDTAVTIDVLANDSDSTGSIVPSSVSVTSAPSNGTITAINSTTGAITYTPNAGYTGSDSFVYQVCDTIGLCSTATVSVTIATGPPVATADSVSTPLDTAVSIDVLANDSDPDGDMDPSTVSVVSAPGIGSVTAIDPLSGAITYTPLTGYTGPDSFTYQVCDATAQCATATVSITVTLPPELGLVAPDGVAYDLLLCGSSLIVDLGVGNEIVLPHAGFDLGYYERIVAGTSNVQFDDVVVQVGTGAFDGSWVTVFNWGDGGPDAHTSLGQAGYWPSEPDNLIIPAAAPQFIGPPPDSAFPTELSGVGIDMDLLGIPSGTYPWVRIVAPVCPNDPSDIDALIVLP